MEKCKKVIQNNKYLGQLRIKTLNYLMALILYHMLKIIIKKHEAVTDNPNKDICKSNRK